MNIAELGIVPDIAAQSPDITARRGAQVSELLAAKRAKPITYVTEGSWRLGTTATTTVIGCVVAPITREPTELLVLFTTGAAALLEPPPLQPEDDVLSVRQSFNNLGIDGIKIYSLFVADPAEASVAYTTPNHHLTVGLPFRVSATDLTEEEIAQRIATAKEERKGAA